MYCRTCGKEIDDNAYVCVNCGCKPLTGKSYCPYCGTATNENQVMCLFCGRSLENTQQCGSKNMYVAAVLAFLLGVIGIHDFYLGYTAKGVVKIVFTITGIFSFVSVIWSLVDLILILTGKLKDSKGLPLKKSWD